jgi:hypothetical protein
VSEVREDVPGSARHDSALEGETPKGDPAVKGKQVDSIEELMLLVEAKRAVICPFRGTPMPAAVAQNWQARQLYNVIKDKRLFVYEKPTKETPTNGE